MNTYSECMNTIPGFDYDEAGHLAQTSVETPPEPICAICDEPIRWCLDMFSLTTGFQEPRFTFAHARCVWIREAFKREGKRAQPDHDTPHTTDLPT